MLQTLLIVLAAVAAVGLLVAIGVAVLARRPSLVAPARADPRPPAA